MTGVEALVIVLLALAQLLQLVARPLFGERKRWNRLQDHLDFVDTLVIVLLEDSGDRRNHNLAQQLRDRRAEWRSA